MMPAIHKCRQCIGPIEQWVGRIVRQIGIEVSCTLKEHSAIKSFPLCCKRKTIHNLRCRATPYGMNIIVINHPVMIVILILDVTWNKCQIAFPS